MIRGIQLVSYHGHVNYTAYMSCSHKVHIVRSRVFQVMS